MRIICDIWISLNLKIILLNSIGNKKFSILSPPIVNGNKNICSKNEYNSILKINRNK